MKDGINRIAVGLSCILLLLSGLYPVWAQEPENLDTGMSLEGTRVETVGERPSSGIPPSVTLTGAYFFDSDIEDTDAEFSLTQGKIWLAYDIFSLGYEFRYYDWDIGAGSTLGSPAQEPWEELHKIAARFDTGGPIEGQKNLTYFIGGEVFLAFESDVSNSEGGILEGGVRYRIAPGRFIRVGAALYHDQPDTDLWPLVALEFESREETGISAYIGFPETVVQYRFQPQLAARLVLNYDMNVYRLEDNSPVAEEGYVETGRGVAALLLDFYASETLMIGAGVQYDFAKEYTIYDEHANTMGDFDVDDALGGIFQARYIF